MSAPFKQLGEEELSNISSQCLVHSFKKGDRIFTEGMPVGDVTYLRKGMVKIQKKLDNGKNVIFQIVQAPGYFGLPSIFGDRVYHTSAEVVIPSEICILPKEQFLKIVEENGKFALHLMKYHCQQELEYIDHTVTLLRQQVPGRLADVLLFFHKTLSSNHSFDIPLSRTELAEFMGVSTKSLARTLKEFISDGLIEFEGNTIQILREDLLKTLVKLG